MTAIPPLPEHQLAATSDELEGRSTDGAQIGALRVRRWLMPASLCLVGALAAVISVLCMRADKREQMRPKRVWSSGELPMEALISNCAIELSPRSDVKLLEDAPRMLRLEVARGAARFDVRFDPRRRIQVSAADVDIRVTGTQFAVTVGGTPSSAAITVQRGSVDVHPRGADRVLVQLKEGESWPQRTTGAAEAASSKVAADAGPNVAPNLDPDVDLEAAPGVPPNVAPNGGPDIGPNARQR